MFDQIYKSLSATGTEINYFFVCKRKLWYSAHQINCENESDNVAAGNLLHSASYQNKRKEYLFDKIKIDWLDLKNGVIHEVKKSDKMEEAHLWQLKYYLHYFREKGIGNFTGELNYPLQKSKLSVSLEEDDIPILEKLLEDIENIKALNSVPPLPSKKSICKKCAYYELCYI